jgi:choice-of-anchor B domain-containing protein
MRTTSSVYGAILLVVVPGALSAQFPAPPTPQQTLATAESPCLLSGCAGLELAVGDGVVYFSVPTSIVGPGRVYAYTRGTAGWAQAASITADGATVGDRFGATIAASGALLAASRLLDDERRGAVFTFERRGQTWAPTGRLQPGDAAPNDSAGIAVAMDGSLLAVGAPGAAAQAGAVYLFRRGADGRWTEEAKLTASDGRAGDGFGRAVAVSGDRVAVGAPLKQNGQGAGYLFVREGSSWRQDAVIPVNTPDDRGLGGARVAFWRDWVVLTAPGDNGAIGAALVMGKVPGEPRWAAFRRVLPFDGRPNGFFGSALAPVDDELWIGSPFAGTKSGFPATFSGAVYRFTVDQAGEYTGSSKVEHPESVTGLYFGSALASTGGITAIGVPGKDHELGSVLVLARTAAGEWRVDGELAPDPESFPRVAGGAPIDCGEGRAAHFECGNMELLSFVPLPELGGARGAQLNDIWGWVDPTTSREYALVGRMDGTSFVDVTDASNPVYLGNLPLTPGATANFWRDIKVYRDHAFIVADGAGAHGVQVFDLTQLRTVRGAPVTFTETAHYDRIFSAHNIVIDEQSGFAFSVGNSMGGETCGGGLHMIDIREPRNPSFAGCFADPQTGIARTGYSHDAQCVTYHGPDQRYTGREICLGSNETMLSISDVTDKSAPVAISRASYPNVQYSHQGWFTEDHRYFYMDDEGDELAGVVPRTRTIIWDVSELDDPIVVGEYLGPTSASDHNLFIRGDLMFQSNYVSGLRVVDISNRTAPVEVGFFDSVPNSDNTPGYSGSWSNYPYFPSGTVVFTSMREGLFVVRPRRPVS